MKAGLLITGNGTLLYLTSHKTFMDEDLILKYKTKGIDKFIAYEVSVEEAKKRYGKHYDIVVQDLHETDDLRILDYDGTRAFKMFSFDEMGKPFFYEEESHPKKFKAV
jgi:hypothetical protein